MAKSFHLQVNQQFCHKTNMNSLEQSKLAVAVKRGLNNNRQDNIILTSTEFNSRDSINKQQMQFYHKILIWIWIWLKEVQIHPYQISSRISTEETHYELILACREEEQSIKLKEKHLLHNNSSLSSTIPLSEVLKLVQMEVMPTTTELVKYIHHNNHLL